MRIGYTKDTTSNAHSSAQHSRPLSFDPSDKRCRSKATVDAGTPQTKGFRLSEQHQRKGLPTVTKV